MTGSGTEAVAADRVEPAVPADQVGPPTVPPVLAAAADTARAAAVEFSAADSVGEHLGVAYEDEFAATHRFVAHLPGYQGWQWAVVLAAVPGAGCATVSEIVLVPGPTALLAPAWVPWEQRIRAGDLSPGDLLAPAVGDERLVPGYTASGDPQLDDVAVELGLGRRWVLSATGRTAAAQRWHDGDYGPDAAMARSTKRACRTCGFYLPLAGALGPLFGVCANEMSADGHVVDSNYGCGAHSDTPPPPGSGSPAYAPYDDGLLETMPSNAPGDPVGPDESPTESSAEPSAQPPAEPPAESSADLARPDRLRR